MLWLKWKRERDDGQYPDAQQMYHENTQPLASDHRVHTSAKRQGWSCHVRSGAVTTSGLELSTSGIELSRRQGWSCQNFRDGAVTTSGPELSQRQVRSCHNVRDGAVTTSGLELSQRQVRSCHNIKTAPGLFWCTHAQSWNYHNNVKPSVSFHQVHASAEL
jgi:hypothetical protein